MDKKALIELLDSLTLNEKIGQLLQIHPTVLFEDGIVTGVINNNTFSEEHIKNIGSVINILGKDKIRAVQENHLKNSKIPLLFMADVIVGYDVIFPSGLSQGCTFDPELIKKLSRISATEMAADGVNVTFSPMVDLCRDARWGRVSESYGEDVLLNCKMAEAVVKGYQGDDLNALDTVSACVKHFAAYSAPVSGRDYNSVDMSERTLRQEYLRSYKAAVDAGSEMLMTSFNTIAGVPCTIDKRLVKDILRDEWGFKGVVITDHGSLGEQYSTGHGVASNSAEVAKFAIDATVDIEMAGDCLFKNIQNLIQEGKLSEDQIDAAVFRILELKNKLGLFEDPYKYIDNDLYEKIDRQQNLEVAKRAVVEGSVLLKNEDSALPINPESTKVAFIGPYLSCDVTSPVWSFHLKNRIVGPTMENYLKENYPDSDFTYSFGCPILDNGDWVSEFCQEDNDEYFKNEDRYIADAVEKAKNADIVVLALGEHYAYHGESKSRADIRLHKIQRDLVDKIYEANQNITAVIFSGRPLDITDISKKLKSILFVWEPGSMAAEGITDMLFGKELPSGKLSMCIPYCVGQMPIHYSELRTGRYAELGQKHSFGSRFVDAPIKPLYPFGYGLTYTTFEYSDLKIDKTTLTPDSEITVTVSVKNTGQRDAWEIVQMYTHDVVAYMVSRPMKELKDFKRVFIKAGETAQVSFKITEDMLRFYNYDMVYESESGEFEVFVGPDSETTDCVTFTLEK